MTYTFKLSRRIARLRAARFAALIVALTGCDNSRTFAPESPDVGGAGSAIDNPVGPASFAGGIPIGMAAQPLTAFGGRFNGAKLTVGPEQIMETLSAVRSQGGKVALMLAGNPRYYTDGSGHFSLIKWRSRVDRFKDINFASYVSDGTVIGHFLMDEPNDPHNWNGQPVPASMVEEMAEYSKQLWPGMPTIVRVEPSYLGGNHRYLDAAWAQYLSRRGDVGDYIRRNVADAQQRGLALVVGMNVLDGGTPNGSTMAASEVEAWGSALLSSSYPCAFISWQYNSDYLSSAAVGSAMDALRRLAQNRSARTCRGAASAGGGTPPPSEPPPSEPPPSEPPPSSPSSGVLFGPYGLPTSEMGSFTGSVRSATPGSVLVTAAAARRAGARVILRLAGDDVTNGDGTFSLTKWKGALDRYGSVDLSSYVSDGTIAGHLLVQNPQSARVWGGRRISEATIEEMARYSRQRWPAVPTIAHAPPSWLAAKTTAWQYLDAASVMYSASDGDAGAWVGEQATNAGKARLGLLVGMNVLNGGTSASGLQGTTPGEYAMSASQLRTWGSTLVARSGVCGLVMSRYADGYFSRSDVKNAIADVSEKARTRAATSCRVRS
jgi:hypothetical protein